MDPAAPPPTNGALALIKAAMCAARLAANRFSMSCRGIIFKTTDPPRRPPAHRRLDQLQRSQSEGGRVVRGRLLPGHDDTMGRGLDPPSPTVNAGSRGLDDSNEAPAHAAVIGLLAFGSCVVIGLLTEFDHTVGGWNAAAKVSYGLLLLLTTSFLGFGVMASVAGTRTMLWVSDLCARLGAILCSALLIVAISCKMGKPWGCAAGVPFAAVVACAMGAIGISWGRARALWTRVVVGRRRHSHQQPTGGDANV